MDVMHPGDREELLMRARQRIADAKKELAEATHDLAVVKLSLTTEEQRLRKRLATAEVAATAATRDDARAVEAAAEELLTAQRLCGAWETEAGVTLGRATQRVGFAAKELREAEDELQDLLRSSQP
jgi:hypothetical protein